MGSLRYVVLSFLSQHTCSRSRLTIQELEIDLEFARSVLLSRRKRSVASVLFPLW